MYERIRKWYLQKLWTAQMVTYACEKGVLTPEEAAAILQQEERIG